MDIPSLKGTPVVIFHKKKYSQSQIVIQIPNGEYTESSTYVVDYNTPEGSRYFNKLENGLNLYEQIMLYTHVLYFPKTGTYEPLEDDDRNVANRFKHIIVGARGRYSRSSRWPFASKGKISTLRR